MRSNHYYYFSCHSLSKWPLYRNLLERCQQHCSYGIADVRNSRTVTLAKRRTTTLTDAGSSSIAASTTIRPSNEQLRRVFMGAAVPMIGFGFTDQTVMLQAGNAIDCTLGVTLALSTLSAAALGQICSDACGVLFGGTLESLSQILGMPKANLTTAQQYLPIVSRVRLMGSLVGVITGCCLGLVNLLFIDTSRSTTLKLRGFDKEQEFEYEITASNAERLDVTTLKVVGPDMDGILASMTAALSMSGCSLVELHAQRDATHNTIQDVFHVVNQEREPFADDELLELAQNLLQATRTPLNVQATISDLREKNQKLQERLERLEKNANERQIKLIKSFQSSQ